MKSHRFVGLMLMLTSIVGGFIETLYFWRVLGPHFYPSIGLERLCDAAAIALCFIGLIVFIWGEGKKAMTWGSIKGLLIMWSAFFGQALASVLLRPVEEKGLMPLTRVEAVVDLAMLILWLYGSKVYLWDAFHADGTRRDPACSGECDGAGSCRNRKPIEEGKVKKGGVNEPPTNPRPPRPHGQCPQCTIKTVKLAPEPNRPYTGLTGNRSDPYR